jgi:hypothetical protein
LRHDALTAAFDDVILFTSKQYGIIRQRAASYQ